MARYVSYTNTGSQALPVSEEHCRYGSSRMGMDQRRDTLFFAGAYNPGTSSARRELGNKHYELSNHLGNVLLSITDKKAYKTLSGSLYFESEISTSSDYYPFGSAMQARAYSAVGYRFGFNTQERETELCADLTSAEFWMYDGKLGRRWNVDPVIKHYTSNYAALGNNPIIIIDINGADTSFIRSDMKTWDKEAASDFHAAYTEISNRIVSMQNDLSQKMKELSSESLSPRSRANLGKEINSLNMKIKEINKLKDDFDYILSKTTPLITYSSDISHLSDMKDGETDLIFTEVTDANGSTTYILKSARISVKPGRLSTYIHENRHTRQPFGLSKCKVEMEAFTYQKLFSRSDVEEKIQAAYEREYGQLLNGNTPATRPASYGIKEMVEFVYGVKCD